MVTTGFSGVEGADVQFGDTVVIAGIGPVGLMSVAGTALRGAGRIICVGHRQITKELARTYGATDIIDYTDGPIPQQVMELTNHNKVDKIIIVGGTPASYPKRIACLNAAEEFPTLPDSSMTST